MARRGDLKRKIKIRPLRRKIYIFSEGENTEPSYFKAYERYLGKTLVEVVCEAERGAPTTLLKLAKEAKKKISSKSYTTECGSRDEVWVVFDEDEHLKVIETINSAIAADIKVAYSNPCFEVWLILHQVDYDKDEHRHLTQDYCETVCAGYTKANRKVPDLEVLISKVDDAERRAIKLEAARAKDAGTAPLTTVYKLTKSIRTP